MRPKSIPISTLTSLYEQVIDEIFDSIIETEYTIIKEHLYDIYRFISKNGYSYDLEFHHSRVPITTRLAKGKIIGDYVKGHEGFTYAIDLGFTPTEREKRDNPKVYTLNTNRHEQIDVMGRITFLIKEFIKHVPEVKIFILGHDTEITKLKIYDKILTNHFMSDFEVIGGENKTYDNGATYLIKKITHKKLA